MLPLIVAWFIVLAANMHDAIQNEHPKSKDEVNIEQVYNDNLK